ncbi:uncharacterized protein LOC129961811 [Argiope bruennichi]|uniref:uncharacterized protein LOC129961811 n=1 Tax=Argiope bruennichi TaxID=94029 RepID=UPI0024957B54|nr:uncharacterized protein LOC129961811 [Argiope bruennichi]
MPFHCSVFNCKGYYDNDPKVSIFKFPEDKKLKAQWTQRLLRKDFKPSKSSRVCEPYFKEEHIIRNMEHFHEESGCILKAPLKYPKLKSHAVPVYVQDFSLLYCKQEKLLKIKKMRQEATAVRKAITESKSSYDKESAL